MLHCVAVQTPSRVAPQLIQDLVRRSRSSRGSVSHGAPAYVTEGFQQLFQIPPL